MAFDIDDTRTLDRIAGYLKDMAAFANANNTGGDYEYYDTILNASNPTHQIVNNTIFIDHSVTEATLPPAAMNEGRILKLINSTDKNITIQNEVIVYNTYTGFDFSQNGYYLRPGDVIHIRAYNNKWITILLCSLPVVL